MPRKRGAPSPYAQGTVDGVDEDAKGGRLYELTTLMSRHELSVQGLADYLGLVTGDDIARMTVQKWLMRPESGGTKDIPGWALVLLRQKRVRKRGNGVSES